MRNLTVLFRYLILTFIVVLAVLSIGLLWDTLELRGIGSDAPGEAELVNQAGRQRMLSEKLVKEVLLSGLITDAAGRQAVQAEALASFEELEQVHLRLSGDKAPFLRQSAARGVSAEDERRIEATFQTLRMEVNHLLRPLDLEPPSGPVPTQLITAAEAYRVAMNEHLARYVSANDEVTRRGHWIMGAALLGGHLVVVGLAWPIMRRARRSVQDLARAYQEREVEREQRRKTRRQYDRLVMAMEQSPNAVMVCEADGTITYANSAIERLCPDPSCDRFAAFGHARTQDRQIALPDLCMIRPEVFGQMHAVLRSGRPWRSREPCVGGCENDMMVSASPIVESTGEVSGGVVLIRDFTHERQTEEFLRQSQKLEALGTLVGGVAHDFNNTLQVISGYLDLALRQVAGSPDLAHDLGEAARAAQSASAVTRQLLAFSRQDRLERQAVDLNELVGSHAQMVRRLLRRDVSLTVEPCAAALPVQADPGSLEQVLLNLYLNAQDAMPTGGVVSVQLERVAADDDFRQGRAWAHHAEYALLRVRDTGVGMSKEVLARIFDPFFTTKAVGKGTGLGLTVAYGILRQHDGMIGAASQPGQGTTVTLYLPIDAPSDSVHMEPPAESPSAGTETILVIESDLAVRALAAAALSSHGFRVCTSEDGEAALRALSSPDGAPAGVVMDTHTPGLAGLRLYEQLLVRHPGLPVVVTCGQASDEDCREMAMRGVPMLKKPYSTTVLVNLLRQLLDLAHSVPPDRPLC